MARMYTAPWHSRERVNARWRWEKKVGEYRKRNIRLEYTEYTILQGIGDTSCCEKTMGVLEIIYNTQGGGGKRYGALLQENVFKRNLETISFGIQTLERKR